MKKLNLLISASLAFTLNGCVKAEKEKTHIFIGVALYDGEDTFIKELSDLVEAYAAESGDVQLKIYSADRSQQTQNSQISEMIKDDVDVLCINLVDRSNPSHIIDEATEASIPIVFFNREPVEADMKRADNLFYVGADAEQSGTMQGEIAADYIESHPEIDQNQDGVIEYYVFEGEPGHQDSIIRSETSIDALNDAGINLKKTGSAICNWSRLEAEATAEQLIHTGITAELILCNNDDMAAGVIDAYNQANITQADRPAIVGIDGTETGLNLVAEGFMIGTVYNDKEKQASAIFGLAKALANGEDTSNLGLDGKYIIVPYQKITADNVSDYLKQND